METLPQETNKTQARTKANAALSTSVMRTAQSTFEKEGWLSLESTRRDMTPLPDA
jgi:hypothetical protein